MNKPICKALTAVLISAVWLGAWPAQTPAGAHRATAKVRTITAGIALDSPAFDRPVAGALGFLQGARKAVVAAGFDVQTLRLTTTPCGTLLQKMTAAEVTAWVRRFDAALSAGKAVAALGPANAMPIEAVIALLSQAENVSATIAVTTADNRLDEAAVRKAAAIVRALSVQTKEGLGNFRFAAIANCPPGIPFFPAGYHQGEASDFAIGMEGASWALNAFSGVKDTGEAKARLQQVIINDIAPLANTMADLQKSSGRTFLGFDVSTAPQGEVSIGKAIEQLSGRPFGGPGTLAASAAITDVLKGLQLKTCGFSGLMLPVMEDATLARRAAEGRLTLDQLLLYSAVCGTGLDVVPLPGDTPQETIESIIRDMAALSIKWKKPLSARLLPVPGKNAGEMTSFVHPFMVNTRVLQLPSR